MRRYARICEVCERVEVTEREWLPAGWRRIEVATANESRTAEACSLECAEALLVKLWTQVRN